MAEHQDLGVLGGRVHPVDAEHFQDAPDETVEEGQGCVPGEAPVSLGARGLSASPTLPRSRMTRSPVPELY
jgi:hypothetical protein